MLAGFLIIIITTEQEPRRHLLVLARKMLETADHMAVCGYSIKSACVEDVHVHDGRATLGSSGCGRAGRWPMVVGRLNRAGNKLFTSGSCDDNTPRLLL